MSTVVPSRRLVSLALSGLLGFGLFKGMPFQEGNSLLQLIFLENSFLFYGIKWSYVAMLFTTPYIVFSLLSSLVYIFVSQGRGGTSSGKLPPYPEAPVREKLFLVIGEVHHARRPEPAENPTWLVIPDKGLFTGTAIFGAVGSGKTTGCILPFAEQVLAYCSNDAQRRVGGLVLEVKGDLCHKMKTLLAKHHRENDYVEISLQGNICYNPLNNDQDSYSLAFGIASLLNNLFGRGKEPFWQQAYTNLVKFIILLHKVLYDYVTLFDVYECAINPQLLELKIEKCRKCFRSSFVSIGIDDFGNHSDLDHYHFVLDPKAQQMRAPGSEALLAYLQAQGITQLACHP